MTSSTKKLKAENMLDPLVTIAIPTFNRRDDILACIQSLEGQTMRNFECFIVDNGPSTDGTSDALRGVVDEDKRFGIVSTGPIGCVIARNVGFRTGSAPILLTLDDDVELVDPTTLSFIVSAFDSDSSLGVLGLSEWYPGGKGKEGESLNKPSAHNWIQKAQNSALYPPGHINRWGMIGTKFQNLEFGRTYDVDHVRSSIMAIRRAAFEHVGGFQEVYTALGYGYRYETDLCVRTKNRGWSVRFNAARPQGLHKVTARPRGWARNGMSDDYLYYTNRNNTLFFLCNYWQRWAFVFVIWDILVSNSSQPGLLRMIAFHREALTRFPVALRGKIEGWRIYRRLFSQEGLMLSGKPDGSA